jgi:hypothetical protein
MNENQCVLCGEVLNGEGENAYPLAQGRCCTRCSREQVLPKREQVRQEAERRACLKAK